MMELWIEGILKNKLRVFLFLLVLGLLTYANVLQGPFLFDDEHFIEKNLMIRSLDNIPDIYTSSVTEGAGIEGNFYRPNQQLMYAILYTSFGLNPLPYHLLSLLLHILNSFLLFYLLSRIRFSKVAALIAGIVFLIHPVQTEAIAYISGLADPLGFFFMLLGLNFFVRYLLEERKVLPLIFSIFFFILAMFTKENQLVFLPIAAVLMIYLLASKQISWSFKFLWPFVIFMMLVASYIYLKFNVFNFGETIGLTDKANVYTASLSMRLYTFINVLWDYAKLIFFPLDLHYEKPYTAFASLASWRAAFGILMILLFFISFIFVKKVPRIFLGLGWFFAALLPFTGIVPLNAMFLEHWLYIPLGGMAILLASLFDFLKSAKAKNIFLFVFIVMMILMGSRSIMRNAEWANIEKFYLNELEYSDNSIRIFNNLGMYYSEEDPAKAQSYYKQSIETGDHYPQPHHNLARLYLTQGDTNAAVQEFYLALQINPQFIYTLQELYQIYTAKGETPKANAMHRMYMNAVNGRPNSFNEIQEVILR